MRDMVGGVGSVLLLPWVQRGLWTPKSGACCDARRERTPAISPAAARSAQPYPAAEAGVEVVGETGVKTGQSNTPARRCGTAGLSFSSGRRTAHLSSSVRRMMRAGKWVPAACLYVRTWPSSTQLGSARTEWSVGTRHSPPGVGAEVVELVDGRAVLEPHGTGLGRERPGVSTFLLLTFAHRTNANRLLSTPILPPGAKRSARCASTLHLPSAAPADCTYRPLAYLSRRSMRPIRPFGSWTTLAPRMSGEGRTSMSRSSWRRTMSPWPGAVESAAAMLSGKTCVSGAEEGRGLEVG